MRDQATLVARLAEALARGPRGLVSAYLHGSHASGRPHQESDVDVGVLLDYRVYPDRAQRDETRIALVGRLQGSLGRNDVDVMILNDAPATLARNVVLDGIRTFCGDARMDHDFRRNAQLRAADLAPFLRRTRRLKLEAIRR